MNWERAFVYTLLAAVAMVLLSGWVLERRPSPRMDIQWHQNCLYAVRPDTGTVSAFPANLCDRDTWKLVAARPVPAVTCFGGIPYMLTDA